MAHPLTSGTQPRTLPAVTVSPWAPLSVRTFRALWIATLVSNVGTWMNDVGSGWLMTSLAPSPLMVALVQAAGSLPAFVLALPGGALADIIDRRRYLIGAMTWSSLVALTLSVLTLTGITTAPILLICALLLGVGTALTMPAWAAIVPELVARPQLQAAIALNSLAINIARAIGPVLAGLIVAVSGPGVVFLLNALSFTGVIAVLARWRRETAPSTLPAERFLGALRSGLRYTRHAPELQATLIRGAAFFLFASATWAFIPLIARQELAGGPTLYGLLLASIGAGAVSGALSLPRLRERLDRDRLVLFATLLYAAAAVAAAWTRVVPLVMVAMFATGAGWIAVLSSMQVSAQTALPPWVRARGLSTYTTVFMGSMTAGAAIWGFAADAIGIPLTLTVAATGLLAGAAATWRFKIGRHEGLDFAPSMHWPMPLVSTELESNAGPVLVTVEYRIDPDRGADFVRVMQRMRRIRRRDGALVWGLHIDITDPRSYLEWFVVESWTEHLRQHERFSVADRETEEQAKNFHTDREPPAVRHFVAAHPPDNR